MELEVNGFSKTIGLTPAEVCAIPVEGDLLSLVMRTQEKGVLLQYHKEEPQTTIELPETIPDNPTLDSLHTAQEFYLMGVHVEQYRDPATKPEAYWREALHKDPEYVPALTALANVELNHFRFDEAYDLAMRAWKKVTTRNFHPESGELQYVIGRILEAQGKDEAAWDWYMQSAWAQDSRSRALTRAAMIAGRRGDRVTMGRLAEQALQQHTHNETALLALALSQKANPEMMQQTLEGLHAYDRLNPTGRAIKLGAVSAFYETLQSDPCQTMLDVAEELVDLGERELACALLKGLPNKCAQTEYVSWYLSGDDAALHNGASLPSGIAWPLRLLEYRALQAAVKASAEDANARDLLACLLYHSEQIQEAEELWEQAANLAPKNPVYLRNMAIARYSHLERRNEAVPMLNQALALHPHDGQLIWEKAYVMLRMGEDPNHVVSFLTEENHPREDIAMELCRALNLAGRHEEALEVLNGKTFTPCEGGEHAIA